MQNQRAGQRVNPEIVAVYPGQVVVSGVLLWKGREVYFVAESAVQQNLLEPLLVQKPRQMCGDLPGKSGNIQPSPHSPSPAAQLTLIHRL
jgi:hypothetical protein